MRLHAVCFAGNEDYQRLAAVLEASAAINSPATPLTVHHVDERDKDLYRLAAQRNGVQRRTFIENARKARHHNEIVQAASDGQVLGLLDCDLMVLGDLSEVQQIEFDLAYTVRPTGSKFPFNTGVVFVRISEAVRRFSEQWYQQTLAMLSNDALHRQYVGRFGGVHQAAFGRLLEDGGHGLRIEQLPCWKWNCEHESWSQFSTETKVVHVISDLRQACLRNTPFIARQRVRIVQQLRAIWNHYSEHAKATA